MEYYKFSKLEKRLLSKVNKAIYDYQMIEANDRVLVAVSGGKDSLSLLRLLKLRISYAKEKYEIVAVHVDLGHTNATSQLEEYFKKNEYEYYIKEYKIFQGSEDKNISCFWCSFNRRMCLFKLAEELNANKIALAHHLNDFVETYLLNLFYHGEISAIPPKLGMFKDKFFIIRPLIYVLEEELKDLAKEKNLPIIQSTCLFKNISKRILIKNLVNYLTKECPNLEINVLRSLKKIRREYLP
jgi:tRNA(Ile)-lysidine synthase TilS/MesJ